MMDIVHLAAIPLFGVKNWKGGLPVFNVQFRYDSKNRANTHVNYMFLKHKACLVHEAKRMMQWAIIRAGPPDLFGHPLR